MPSGPPTSTSQIQRLLVRGVNWLGDAVMTTPALHRLRERLPQTRITLLTHEKLAPLWLQHPSLDDIATFASGEGPWAVARRLGREDFDAALLFPNSHRSALEAWLARIPRRIGYSRPWRNWLLTQSVPARSGHVEMRKRSAREVNDLIRSPNALTPHSFGSPNRGTGEAGAGPHHIHQYLHLSATLEASSQPLSPELRVMAEEIQAVAAKLGLSPEQTAGRPILGLNPGAEYGPAKRWPAERFAAAAGEIHKRTKCIWLLLGGPGELALATALVQRSTIDPRHLRNLAGQTSLRELMALLKLCRVLLTNDSGPMHVAAALGTPVVVPFGSTSPELTGPGLPGEIRHHLLQSNAPCSPCFRRTCPIDLRCMNAITVEQVVVAVLNSLAGAR